MMRKLVISLFVLSYFFALTVNTKAQKEPMKFGKIPKEDLKMEVCPFDSAANAMLLCDFGKSNIVFDRTDFTFKLMYERHVRIKIFNKEGYEHANIEIPLYHSDGYTGQERLFAFKAKTFNLIDGREKVEKVKRRDLLKEKKNENWDILKLAMPQVQEGSVLDIYYAIQSDFAYNLREWQFQHDIPVRWSEYRVKYPEYYYYNQTIKGYVPLVIKENSTSQGGATFKNGARLSYLENVYRYAAENIPAFEREPYLTTADDYISKVVYELSWIQFPQQTRKNYTTTWEAINKKLLEHQYFGNQLDHAGFVKDEVAQLTEGAAGNEKIANIFNFVKTKMKWNGEKSIFVDETLRRAFKNSAGNTADINMLLVLMLRQAGINAEPVVLSTRSNGKVHPAHPTISKFNYVIAAVMTDEGNYLLDATHPNLPAGMLPFQCLNGQGRIISKTNSNWINLRSSGLFSNSIMQLLTLNPDGTLNGKVKKKSKGYSAYNLREKINEETEEKYIEKIQDNNEGLLIEDYSFEALDDISKDVTASYDVEITGKAQVANDMIYLNPMLYEKIDENPFKIEERKYPVDFGCPIEDMYMLNLTIPEGYVVEELPEPTSLKLPDNKGMFLYNIQTNGKNIQLNCQFKISKTLFVASEYKSIKEFYNMVIAKQAEQIVLKKAS